MGIEFIPLLSFMLITTFTPGPNNIACASMGVNYGYRRSLGFMLGIASGVVVVMILCALMSGFLLTSVPVAEKYLRWAGAGYIVWLAISIFRSGAAENSSEEVKGAFLKGMVLQLFNPKVLVYGITVYTTFLAPLAGKPLYQVIAAPGLALFSFLSITTWALFGAAIKMRLKNGKFRFRLNAVLAILLIYTAVDLIIF